MTKVWRWSTRRYLTNFDVSWLLHMVFNSRTTLWIFIFGFVNIFGSNQKYMILFSILDPCWLYLPSDTRLSRCTSVVYWLERWPSNAMSAQQWRFESNTLSVVSGVTTLRLANLPEKFSVAYIWTWFLLELISRINSKYFEIVYQNIANNFIRNFVLSTVIIRYTLVWFN